MTVVEKLFSMAVRWTVQTELGAISVEARSESKARRAVARFHPLRVVERVELAPLARAGALVADLPTDIDMAVRAPAGEHGEPLWTLCVYEGGQVTVRREGAAWITVPAYVVAELRTVWRVVDMARAARDGAAIMGQVAMLLLHEVVLSAPALHPSEEVTHATAGRHPDGLSGYACVTDPGGRFDEKLAVVSHMPPRKELDRSAFAAAACFVERVGAVGALWAISAARS